MECVCLNELAVGERGVLVSIEEDHVLLERLMDLGWTSGTPLCCVGVSPLGDPRAYAIRGGVIALRKRDGQGIYIKREKEGGHETDEKGNRR